MDLQNMSNSEIVAVWNEASADLKGCSWHHASAHRIVHACIRNLAHRGYFVPARGTQSVEID